MTEYKILCSNFPPDQSDLIRMAQENWEFVAVCTIHPGQDIDGHIANMPGGMAESGEKVCYVWYFKRIV